MPDAVGKLLGVTFDDGLISALFETDGEGVWLSDLSGVEDTVTDTDVVLDINGDKDTVADTDVVSDIPGDEDTVSDTDVVLDICDDEDTVPDTEDVLEINGLPVTEGEALIDVVTVPVDEPGALEDEGTAEEEGDLEGEGDALVDLVTTLVNNALAVTDGDPIEVSDAIGDFEPTDGDAVRDEDNDCIGMRVREGLTVAETQADEVRLSTIDSLESGEAVVETFGERLGILTVAVPLCDVDGKFDTEGDDECEDERGAERDAEFSPDDVGETEPERVPDGEPEDDVDSFEKRDDDGDIDGDFETKEEAEGESETVVETESEGEPEGDPLIRADTDDDWVPVPDTLVEGDPEVAADDVGETLNDAPSVTEVLCVPDSVPVTDPEGVHVEFASEGVGVTLLVGD